MSEHPGFTLYQIDDRSIVQLRVRPLGADAASDALDIPRQALQCTSGDPSAYWLGPDQWLLISDTKTADEVISHIDRTLSGQLYAATDMSSGKACFSLRGRAARMILAMGCGIDMHFSAFKTGQCTQTIFARVSLIIVAVDDDRFDLYVDRSHARYLGDWIKRSGEDPMTRYADSRMTSVS